MQNPQEHINVFIAYSRKDRTYLDGLRTHLKPLERNEKLNIWDDGEITPGAEWEREIKHHLNSAHIILLFISADSLSSEYFYGKEMKGALKRHHSGEATVIPVILRPCLWHKETALGGLQALPKDGIALSTWNDIESGYTDIANGVDKVIEDVKVKSKAAENKRIEDKKRRRLAQVEKQHKLEERKRLEEDRQRIEREQNLQRQIEERRKAEIEEHKKRRMSLEKINNRLRYMPIILCFPLVYYSYDVSMDALGITHYIIHYLSALFLTFIPSGIIFFVVILVFKKYAKENDTQSIIFFTVWSFVVLFQLIKTILYI